MFSKWPYYDQKDIESVKKVLKSGKVNYWTGSNGKLFEKTFSSFSDVKYSLAIANGTLALEIALKSLMIKKNDQVIVTSRSFVASASCVVSLGAKPVFADVDLETQNLSAKTIEPHINKKTKAIILVHLAGMPCEMNEIMKLANKKNIKVIEDCSQAHGAKYYGKSVGSIGDIGTWSFCNDKIISTAGEGGMITTNNKKIYEFCHSYRDHGKIFKQFKKNDNSFKWLHDNFGSNYRLTEIQSVIGLNQLSKLKKWNKIRERNSLLLLSEFKKFPELFIIPQIPNYINHAWYKCYVFISDKAIKKGINKSYIQNYLVKRNVPCFSGSCSEIYLEKSFKDSKLSPKKRFPNAKQLGERSIMFPVDQTFKLSDIKKICLTINEVINDIINKNL